jgi:hypothetical protein
MSQLMQNLKHLPSTLAGLAGIVVLALQSPDVQAAITMSPKVAAWASKAAIIAGAVAFVFGRIHWGQQVPDTPKVIKMPSMILFLPLFLLIPLVAKAAEPDNVFVAGVAWNQYAAPQISGNLTYAHRIGEGLYNFNLVDVTSRQTHPFSAAVSIAPGLAKKFMTINGIKIYELAAAGIMTGDNRIGFAWSTGGAAIIPLGKQIWLMPSVRVLKASMIDFQSIYGIAIGFGK